MLGQTTPNKEELEAGQSITRKQAFLGTEWLEKNGTKLSRDNREAFEKQLLLEKDPMCPHPRIYSAAESKKG